MSVVRTFTARCLTILMLCSFAAGVHAAETLDIEFGGKSLAVVVPEGFVNLAGVAPKLVNVVQETYPAHNVHAALVQNVKLAELKRNSNAKLGLVHLLMSSKHPGLQNMTAEKFGDYQKAMSASVAKADMSTANILKASPDDPSTLHNHVKEIVDKDDDGQVNQVAVYSLDRNDATGVQMTVLNIQALKIDNNLEVYTQANSSTQGLINATAAFFSTVVEVTTAEDIEKIRDQNKAWFDATMNANGG